MTAAASPTTTPPATPPSAAGPTDLGGPLREHGTTLHPSVRAATWTARGLTKVLGSVEVGTADLGGAVTIGGDVKAQAVSVRGSLNALGALIVEGELGVHGQLSAASLRVGTLAASGSVHSDGAVEATDRLVVRGSFSAPSVSAAEARLAGSVRVSKELRAAGAELELANGSEIGTIVAGTVRVTGPEGGLLDRILGKSREARVGRVEGERVTLERVDVESVFATEVTIGRDCHVRSVEATEVHVHPSSRVGPASRSPPPVGLRR